jgi:arylesterase / paraoxonase
VGDGAERRLFVVNHRSRTKRTVEIFAVERDRLPWVDTIAEPDLMHSPNDVAPTGPWSFYVTNMRGARSLPGGTWETVRRRPGSYVLYYDGSDFHKVAEGLRYANGINLSRDRRTVYVATFFGQEVRLYDRAADGSLALREVIEVNTGADNLEVDEAGNLWIGAQPSPGRFFLYAIRLRKQAPSQVLMIPRHNGEYGPPEEVYRDNGELLSGSSVAALYKRTLLIGSVLDGFLVCELRR